MFTINPIARPYMHHLRALFNLSSYEINGYNKCIKNEYQENWLYSVSQSKRHRKQKSMKIHGLVCQLQIKRKMIL